MARASTGEAIVSPSAAATTTAPTAATTAAAVVGALAGKVGTSANVALAPVFLGGVNFFCMCTC